MKCGPLLALVDEDLLAEGRRAFRRHGIAVCEAARPDAVMRMAESSPSMVVIEHSPRCPWDGAELAGRMRRASPALPIYIVANPSSEETAIAALRSGVTDYFRRPVPFEELAAAASLQREADAAGEHLIGESACIRKLRAAVGRIAVTDSNVLITGETGVGKELFARMIHRLSARRNRAFVCINCAALPDTLLESELFGHERGAFTDARTAYAGKLKLGDGGTVLLDEVGDMSLYAQAKILRAIEAKEVYRLGGMHPVAIDVRIIAATNQDLATLCRQGRFREDLYYRLNIARLHLPPLRERREDVPPLLDFYRRDLNRRFARRVDGFSQNALNSLTAYPWPGNVRELKNVLEAVYIHLDSATVQSSDLPEAIRGCDDSTGSDEISDRVRLLRTLMQVNWNKSRAAHELHWSRMTVYRKIAKYGLKTRAAG